MPYKMYGDEVRLRQIITNIVNNSIKFTESGYVKLKVSSTKVINDRVNLNITVEDTGIGIKKQDKEKLFETFTQVDTIRNRKIEGTGLGLSICKSLLELMDGSINLTSEYGKGSVFQVILPQKVIRYRSFVDIPIKNSHQKILVYEPNKYYENSLKYSFNSLNIKVDYEKDEKKFIDKALSKQYNHLFLPINIIDKIDKKALNSECKITAMVEGNESYRVVEGIKIIQKPLYSLPIATILNNDAVFSLFNENLTEDKNKFIAPKAKILIVDDNAVNLKVATGLILPYMMKVDTAMSGYEAIDKISKKDYDIIFMDHMMPNMDGVETTKRIRKLIEKENRSTVIIALTANAIIGAKEMFLENGMNDFLSKPIEIKKLHFILNKWIPQSLKVGVGEVDEVCSPSNKKEVDEKTANIHIHGINAEKSMRINGFNKEVYLDLLNTFLKDSKCKIDCITSYIDSDLKRYIVEVHGVKSAANSIGAYDLSDKAKRLEEAGKLNDIEYIKTNNLEFINNYKRLLIEVERVLLEGIEEIQENISEIKLEYIELMKKLNYIKDYLEIFDSEEASSVIKEILSYNIDQGMRVKLERVLEHINMFQYDEALKEIESIIR